MYQCIYIRRLTHDRYNICSGFGGSTPFSNVQMLYENIYYLYSYIGTYYNLEFVIYIVYIYNLISFEIFFFIPNN